MPGKGATMTVTVEQVTRDRAIERQHEILRELGMSAEEMLQRAGDFDLQAHERGLANEYERLGFLLANAA